MGLVHCLFQLTCYPRPHQLMGNEWELEDFAALPAQLRGPF